MAHFQFGQELDKERKRRKGKGHHAKRVCDSIHSIFFVLFLFSLICLSLTLSMEVPKPRSVSSWLLTLTTRHCHILDNKAAFTCYLNSAQLEQICTHVAVESAPCTPQAVWQLGEMDFRVMSSHLKMPQLNYQLSPRRGKHTERDTDGEKRDSIYSPLILVSRIKRKSN